MIDEVKVDESAPVGDSQTAMELAFDKLHGEVTVEEAPKEEVIESSEVEAPTAPPKEEQAEEITTEEETEAPQEETEEVEAVEPEEEGIEGEIDSLDQKLSGFVPEYKDLVNSIEDPDLKERVLDAGKKQRAAIDRKLSELGELKKQNGEALENYSRMDKQFKEDPRALIEMLAKAANIQLNDLASPAQTDSPIEDDYRLPEEIKRDQELEDIKKELHSIKYAKQQEEQLSAQQEIDNFKNAVDEKGNPKYPHFERVKTNMGLLIGQEGITLESAYGKAILLDDELSAERDAEMLRKIEAKRKYRVEKAKKLKKQSLQTKSLDTSVTDPGALMEQAYDNLMMA